MQQFHNRGAEPTLHEVAVRSTKGLSAGGSLRKASTRDLARFHYNRKEYIDAEPYLDELVNQNSNDWWALDVLSRLYINTNRKEMALPLLKKLASREDPSDVVLKRLIRISTEMEDASIVVSIFRNAIGRRTMVLLLS